MGLLRKILNLVNEEKYEAEAVKRFLDHHSSFTFGTTTITFFDYADLDRAQADYKINMKGKRHSTATGGQNWDKSWMVIGHEHLCNDPIIVDTYSSKLPVYTAIYDNGAWETAELAGSLASFQQIIRETNALQSQELPESTLKESLIAVLDRQNPDITNWWWESHLEELTVEL